MIRFFKVTDLDVIRIGEKENEKHLQAKTKACLNLARQGKEFITDCWIRKRNYDHEYVDIFVTEDKKVIKMIPFEEIVFILDREKKWEKEGIDYEVVTY